jgi:uncharacterized protein (TIGR04222 family)
MNPFDLRGPAFLVLYVVLSAVGLILLYLAQRGVILGEQRRASADGRKHLHDPYLVAYLRGGAREVLHTLVFALNQRKLVTNADAKLVASGSLESWKALPNSLESLLMSCLYTARPMRELIDDASLKAKIEAYAQPLRESGLIADDAERARRWPALLGVAGVLAALSGVKILVALQRGHPNIIFLAILTLIVMASCYSIYRSPKTNAGRRALRDQQSLFGRLRNRVNRMAAQGATNEAVLVAATFGLDSLPAAEYPMAAMLHHQSKKGSSSCSSGCGSSCGGGGCGGGCGGCGS